MDHASPSGGSRDALVASLLVFLVLGTVLAARPLVGVPMNDDFSYAHSARALAETGRLAYNGWGSPLLWPQAALGALIIGLGGFSYKTLAAAGIALAGLSVAAMYALARRSGCAPFWSALATAALALNPIFLCVAPSFLTDVPSLFLLLLALLALVRSLRGDEGGVSVDRRWFFASVLLGLVAGSNRQVSWVAYGGALAALAALLPRERRLVLAALGAVLVGAALLVRWQSAQPYTLSSGIAEGLLLIVGYPNVAFVFVYKFLNLLGLFLIPLALPAFWARRGNGVRPLRLLVLLALCLLPVFYAFGTTFTLLDGSYRLTDYGQYFTSSGVLVGGVAGYERRPPVFGAGVAHALVLAGAVGLALALYLLVDTFREARRERAIPALAGCLLAVSALAQIAASLPWYALRYTFDRYVLFLLPGLLIPFALRAGAGRPPRWIVGATMASLAVLWIAGYGFLTDYMSYTRARAALYERLIRRGVSPRHIDGGVEFLGDTQIRAAGYVNNHEIQNPRNAFRKNAAGRGVSYLPERFPAIDARFRLSTDAHPDPAALDPDPVDSVAYRSPFPPRSRTMYVYEIRR